MRPSRFKHFYKLLLVIGGLTLLFAYQNCQTGGSTLGALASHCQDCGGTGGDDTQRPDLLSIDIDQGTGSTYPVYRYGSDVDVRFLCNTGGLTGITVLAKLFRGAAQITRQANCPSSSLGMVNFGPLSTLGLPSNNQNANMTFEIHGYDSHGVEYIRSDSSVVNFTETDPPDPGGGDDTSHTTGAKFLALTETARSGNDLKVYAYILGYDVGYTGFRFICQGSGCPQSTYTNLGMQYWGDFFRIEMTITGTAAAPAWKKSFTFKFEDPTNGVSDEKSYSPVLTEAGTNSRTFRVDGCLRGNAANQIVMNLTFAGAFSNHTVKVEYRSVSDRTATWSSTTAGPLSGSALSVPINVSGTNSLSDVYIFRVSDQSNVQPWAYTFTTNTSTSQCNPTSF